MNIVILGLLLIGAVEAQAVDYKSTYKGQERSMQPTEYQIAQTATAPAVGFQSTSAMPVNSTSESTLNEDGTVNAEAYGVGLQETQAQAPNRAGHVRKGWAIEGDPLGDVFWPLALLACVYALMRAFLKRKRA